MKQTLAKSLTAPLIRAVFVLFVLASLAGLASVLASTATFQQLEAWYHGAPQTNYVEQIQLTEFRSEIKVTSFSTHMAILTAQMALFGALVGWFFCLWRPGSRQPWSTTEILLATCLFMVSGGFILAYSSACLLSLPGTASICGLYAKESVIDAAHWVGFLASALMLWLASWRFYRRGGASIVIAGTALVGMAAFVFGMEEISWGQTYLQWQSPEFFATYNDQQETNAHNFFNAYLTPIYYMIGATVLAGTVAVLVITDLVGERWTWAKTLCPPRLLLWVAVWFPLGSEIFIFSSTETFETLLTIYALTYAATILLRSSQSITASGERWPGQAVGDGHVAA